MFIVAEFLDGQEGTPMTRKLSDRDGDEKLLRGLIAPKVSTHVYSKDIPRILQRFQTVPRFWFNQLRRHDDYRFDFSQFGGRKR